MLFQSYILKCNIVFPALFTQELSRLDQLLTEKLEPHHKESKEMQQEELSKKEMKTNENMIESSISYYFTKFLKINNTIYSKGYLNKCIVYYCMIIDEKLLTRIKIAQILLLT
jgi:hypothetical protein